MIQPFRPERIQKLCSGVAACESAEVCPVVDSSKNETENEKRDRPRFRLVTHNAAAGSTSVINQSAQQAENRRRSSHRSTRSAEERNECSGECARCKSRDAGDRVNDHHPACAIHFRCCGRELTNPHHVEENVQQSGVQPARRQECPPSSV